MDTIRHSMKPGPCRLVVQLARPEFLSVAARQGLRLCLLPATRISQESRDSDGLTTHSVHPRFALQAWDSLLKEHCIAQVRPGGF